MRSVRAKYIWGVAVVLCLVLGLALAGTPAQARSLDSREEAALFSLNDLGQVDLSPKTVIVEVYVAPEPELADCRRMLAQVWEQVRQFYAPMGVNLVEVSGQAQPGPLAPAKRLRPILALLVAETLHGDSRSVVGAACAVEMVLLLAMIRRRPSVPTLANLGLPAIIPAAAATPAAKLHRGRPSLPRPASASQTKTPIESCKGMR
jgi:hypothetical protein